MKRLLVLAFVAIGALLLITFVGTYLTRKDVPEASNLPGEPVVTTPRIESPPNQKKELPQAELHSETKSAQESVTNTSVPVTDTNLSPGKEECIKEAWRKFPDSGRQTNVESVGAINPRLARLDFLSSCLSPEEFVDYRRNREPIEFLLRRQFDYARFKLSDEEFHRVFLALASEDLLRREGGYVEYFYLFSPAAEEKLKDALGPQRYADYQDMCLPANRLFSEFANRYHLDDDTFDQIRALRNSAPRNGDREPFQIYSNSVSLLLRDRHAIEEFFRDPTLLMRPHRPK